MRKIALVISGLIVLATALVACFDKKDFEFDRFTISDLNPTLYLPLLNDTIRLDGSGDYDVRYDEAGQGYLHFALDNDILPPASDFFEVPITTYTVVGTPFSYNGSGTSFTVGPQTHTAEYYLSSPDQQLDSIAFRTGRVTFDVVSPVDANGYYVITIPDMRKNGEPFSVTVNYGQSYSSSLAGYMLKFQDGNTFDVVVELTIINSSMPAGDYTFDASIDFNNIEVESVYGYFGQQTVQNAPVRVNVSAFDKFRNNATTALRIKEAFLDFRVDNGAGFPIRLRMDEVTSIAAGQHSIKHNVDSVTIPANEPRMSYFRSTHSVGGEAFGETLSNMPSEVEFKFSGTINPEGSRGGTVKNFLTDASVIAVSHAGVRIPLNFSVTGMTLKDTLTFNSTKVKFNDMELLMNIENNMPVEVALQAFLMDEYDNVTGPLFNAPVTIPAAAIDPVTGIVTAPHLYVEKIDADVSQLEQTKKIKVDITVRTDNPSSTYVRVTKDNYVYLRIGAKTNVNIDNLD
jgi:hypothetical protein